MGRAALKSQSRRSQTHISSENNKNLFSARREYIYRLYIRHVCVCMCAPQWDTARFFQAPRSHIYATTNGNVNCIRFLCSTARSAHRNIYITCMYSSCPRALARVDTAHSRARFARGLSQTGFWARLWRAAAPRRVAPCVG